MKISNTILWPCRVLGHVLLRAWPISILTGSLEHTMSELLFDVFFDYVWYRLQYQHAFYSSQMAAMNPNLHFIVIHRLCWLAGVSPRHFCALCHGPLVCRSQPNVAISRLLEISLSLVRWHFNNAVHLRLGCQCAHFVLWLIFVARVRLTKCLLATTIVGRYLGVIELSNNTIQLAYIALNHWK